MYISTSTEPLFNLFGYKKALNILKDAGFTAFDLTLCGPSPFPCAPFDGDDYAEIAREVRAYADSIGAVCNQAHAPFEMRSEQDFSQTSSAYVRITRAIEAAAILGASVIVVHPIKLPGERFYEINREFYRSLIEKWGIETVVCDYLSSMTDRYAVWAFEELFVPKSFYVKG